MSDKFKSDMSDFLTTLGYSFFKVDVAEGVSIALRFYTNPDNELEYINFNLPPDSNVIGFSARYQPDLVHKMIKHFNLDIYNYSNDFSFKFKNLLEKYAFDYSFEDLGKVQFSSNGESFDIHHSDFYHTKLARIKGDLSYIYKEAYDNEFDILIEHIYKFTYSLSSGFNLKSFIKVSGDYRRKSFIEPVEINAKNLNDIDEYLKKIEAKSYKDALKRIGEVTGDRKTNLTVEEFENSLDLLKMIKI